MAVSPVPPSHFSRPPQGRWTVAVLFGGSSAEREISLASGTHVIETLSRLGHRVVPVDPQDVNLLSYDWTGIDIAFLALHGKFGEDGHVQQILEAVGVPYTGSDADASRVGISKSATKERLAQNGVPTAPYVLIHASDDRQRIHRQAQQVGFPLVVKPDTQGSSLGVSLIHHPEELPAALEKAFSLDAFAIIERAIIGSEWTVGLLDRQILPSIQIRTDRQFFDFQAKYRDDDTGYCFDYDVPANVVDHIEQVALHAAEALGTRGMARVDIMLDHDLHPWVLEINTIPGMTDHSLVPKAAARMGWDFGELCERAIRSGLTAVRNAPSRQFRRAEQTGKSS